MTDVYEYEELVPRKRRVTIDDIYWPGVYTPIGFERTDEFRPPKDGEWFISDVGEAMRCNGDYKINHPRLILREKAKRQVLVTVLEREVGKDVSVEQAEELLADFPLHFRIEERD